MLVKLYSVCDLAKESTCQYGFRYMECNYANFSKRLAMTCWALAAALSPAALLELNSIDRVVSKWWDFLTKILNLSQVSHWLHKVSYLENQRWKSRQCHYCWRVFRWRCRQGELSNRLIPSVRAKPKWLVWKGSIQHALCRHRGPTSWHSDSKIVGEANFQ